MSSSREGESAGATGSSEAEAEVEDEGSWATGAVELESGHGEQWPQIGGSEVDQAGTPEAWE